MGRSSEQPCFPLPANQLRFPGYEHCSPTPQRRQLKPTEETNPCSHRELHRGLASGILPQSSQHTLHTCMLYPPSSWLHSPPHTHTYAHVHARTMFIQQMVAHTLHIHTCMLYPSSSQLHSCTLMHAVFTHYKHVMCAHTTHNKCMHDMHTQCTHCMLIHTIHATQTHMAIPHHVSDTQRNIHMSHAQSTYHTEYTPCTQTRPHPLQLWTTSGPSYQQPIF